MNHNYAYEDALDFENDRIIANSFRLSWPINEIVLLAALNNQMTVRDIADEYDVSVDKVIDLCEQYDLDWT